MRLIDADALHITAIGGRMNGKVEFAKAIEEAIKKAPTIDAVEVVRCKDCKWGKEVCGNIECWADMNLPPEYHGYDWYCPSGEREEHETD